jgi:hypothetical protein
LSSKSPCESESFLSKTAQVFCFKRIETPTTKSTEETVSDGAQASFLGPFALAIS